MRNSLLSRNRTIAATHGRVAGCSHMRRRLRCSALVRAERDSLRAFICTRSGHCDPAGACAVRPCPSGLATPPAVWLVVVLVAAAAEAAEEAAAVAAALPIPSRYAGATTGQQLLAVPPTPATTSPLLPPSRSCLPCPCSAQRQRRRCPPNHSSMSCSPTCCSPHQRHLYHRYHSHRHGCHSCHCRYRCHCH